MTDNGGTANGGVDTSAAVIVTVNVLFVNHAPQASNLIATTPDDTAVTSTLVASDMDSSPFVYVITMLPLAGTLVLNNMTGVFTYTPPSDPYLSGLYTFSFQVTETGPPPDHPSAAPPYLSSAVAYVTLNLTFVEHPPTASAVTLSTLENVAVNGVFPASSPDAAELTYWVGPTSFVPDACGSVSVGDTAAFTFTPAVDFFGTCAFNYTVSDGIASPVTSKVTVSVTNVNQAPSFVLPPVIVLEGNIVTGSYADFLENLTMGPNEDFTQSLIGTTVAVSDPTLFLVQPAVSLDGTLTYTVASYVYGSCNVTVTVQDSGGTAHGGVAHRHRFQRLSQCCSLTRHPRLWACRR